jgi:glucose/arabinose dehydrogenase
MTRNPNHCLRKTRFLTFTTISILISHVAFLLDSSILNEQDKMLHQAAALPSLVEGNENLEIQIVVSGLSEPTGFAFVDNSTLLVIEKGGQVRMILNGRLMEEPLLSLPVDSINERGLLGIAIRQKVVNDQERDTNATDLEIDTSPIRSENNFVGKTGMEVFLFFTERLPAWTDSVYSSYGSTTTSEELRNRVYKYQWKNQNLTNPELILDLPALPGPNHNGGKIAIGPDNYLYAIIGDLNHKGKLQNVKNGPEADDTGVILRINPDKSEQGFDIKYNNSLSSSNRDNSTTRSDVDDINYNITQRYYAYGIRNSFGIAFDPLTGRLWETENGLNRYDEINVVEPGFNSGWQVVMGPLSRNSNDTDSILRDKLVLFPWAYYSDPVISWKEVVAPTAIEFINSSKLGEAYKDNIFVGDHNNGNLYFLKVNNTRNGISLDADNNGGFIIQQQHNRLVSANSTVDLSDLVVDNNDELSTIVFGKGFGSITDIKTGPDGYVYVVSFHDGILYRIQPSEMLSYSQSRGGEGGELHQQQSLSFNLSEKLLPQAITLINSKYAEWKGINGPLGRPISNVSLSLDGFAFSALYETGAIYWKIGGIPHEIHGSIYNKWKNLGAELSELGYPITDQRPSISGDGGYFNLFEHGAIYWTPNTGAHAIYGDIYNRWKNLGAELSELGYPLTDVQYVAEGQGSLSYFEGGSIRVFSNNGTVQVLHSKDYADIIGQNDVFLRRSPFGNTCH